MAKTKKDNWLQCVIDAVLDEYEETWGMWVWLDALGQEAEIFVPLFAVENLRKRCNIPVDVMAVRMSLTGLDTDSPVATHVEWYSNQLAGVMAYVDCIRARAEHIPPATTGMGTTTRVTFPTPTGVTTATRTTGQATTGTTLTTTGPTTGTTGTTVTTMTGKKTKGATVIKIRTGNPPDDEIDISPWPTIIRDECQRGDEETRTVTEAFQEEAGEDLDRLLNPGRRCNPRTGKYARLVERIRRRIRAMRT